MAETFEDVLERHELAGTDIEFRQRLLSRMEQDCNYWLGNGGGADKHLWAGEPREQLAVMKALWLSLPEGENRRLLSLQDIEAYALRMGVGLEALPVDGEKEHFDWREELTDRLEEAGCSARFLDDETLEIEFDSPAGEDFVFEAEGSDLYEIVSSITSYFADFDPGEHAAKWYGANRGEPSSLRDLLDDADSIDESLKKFSEVAQQVEKEYEEFQAEAEEQDPDYVKEQLRRVEKHLQRQTLRTDTGVDWKEFLADRLEEGDFTAIFQDDGSLGIDFYDSVGDFIEFRIPAESANSLSDIASWLNDFAKDFDSSGRLPIKEGVYPLEDVAAAKEALTGLSKSAQEAVKEYDAPFYNFEVGKWGVRFVLPGENYGVNEACVYEQEDADKFGDGLPLVEFYDKSQDPAKFPGGQFVARYYMDTLCRQTDYTPRIDQMTMFDLDGSVPAWTIAGEDMEVVGKNLMGMYRRACESRGEAQGVAKEDKGYSLDSACKAASEAKDSRVGERTSAVSRDEIR